VTKQLKAAVVNFPNKAGRFTAVHVDIVGPYHRHRQQRDLFIC
jgi:hypothetical protein